MYDNQKREVKAPKSEPVLSRHFDNLTREGEKEFLQAFFSTMPEINRKMMR